MSRACSTRQPAAAPALAIYGAIRLPIAGSTEAACTLARSRARARCSASFIDASGSPMGSDPGHAGWQRDLSVSYIKVGNVQVAQGDQSGALKSYRDSLAIRERLARSDPGNASWQRDLAVSHAKLA